jgi:tight adherence protein B
LNTWGDVVLMVLGTFVGVLVFVLGAFWMFVVRPEAGTHRSLQKRLRPQIDAARKKDLTIAKAESRRRVTPFKRLQSVIDQSGRRLTVGGLLVGCALCGLTAGLPAWMLSRHPAFAAVGALFAAMVPYWWVKYLAGKRMWKFEEQFPEAVDLIARALRAGHAFPTGLSMVADELGDPVGPEFKLLYDRQNFGMPMPDALRSFAARVPLIDARFFVTAVLTQREAGGNLSGVLDNLSSVIRERFKVKRQVSVISAHGRITAAILSGLPPVVAAAQFIMVPTNAAMLVTDPLGQRMLLGAVGLWAIGMVWIRKVIRIEY